MSISTIKKRKIKRKGTMVNLYSYKVPNIIIVGDKKIRKKVHNIEKNFNISLIFTDAENLLDTINSKTIAILVDEEKVKSKLKHFLIEILTEHIDLPVFFLSRTNRKPNFYVELYEKGLVGAINWPSESRVLHDLVIECLRPHPAAIGKTKGDEKLSKIIKSHLILSGNHKKVKVKVIDGFVFLEGSVKSLYDQHSVAKESAKVLGVKKVITKNMEVKSYKNITDKEIERKIKMYIGNILGDSKRSLTAKVKDKVVKIIGAAANHGDVFDIEKFAMKQIGVKRIIRKVKYRPSLVSKNVKRAKLLENRVKNIFSGVKYISIHIYGEYVEVSGTIKSNADRVLVESYLLQVLPVKRVVNKLFIGSS